MSNFEGTDLMHLLGVSFIDLDNPARSRKFESVLRYFKDDSSARRQVLKIISRDNRDDKLDAVWTWVQLELERQEALKELDPQDFTDDVQSELKQGYLSQEKIEELKGEMDRLEREQQAKQVEAKIERAQDVHQRQAEDQALESALSPVRIDAIRQRLDNYAQVVQELKAYE